MKIPSEAIIAPDKLTNYLLQPRQRDDKSKFLAQAGFRRDAPEALDMAIRQLAAEQEAIVDSISEYGIFYQVAGRLSGPNGIALPAVTIWLRWRSDDTYHFVTLKPYRGER